MLRLEAVGRPRRRQRPAQAPTAATNAGREAGGAAPRPGASGHSAAPPVGEAALRGQPALCSRQLCLLAFCLPSVGAASLTASRPLTGIHAPARPCFNWVPHDALPCKRRRPPCPASALPALALLSLHAAPLSFPVTPGPPPGTAPACGPARRPAPPPPPPHQAPAPATPHPQTCPSPGGPPPSCPSCGGVVVGRGGGGRQGGGSEQAAKAGERTADRLRMP